MITVLGKPLPVLMAQLLLGLVNGSFYALLSLGLAVIFGLLNVINFAHGALYMIGAYVAWYSLEKFGLICAGLICAGLICARLKIRS